MVIARNSDKKSNSFVDYCALNKRLKEYNFCIPSVEEIHEDINISRVFSKLDTFANY